MCQALLVPHGRPYPFGGVDRKGPLGGGGDGEEDRGMGGRTVVGV